MTSTAAFVTSAATPAAPLAHAGPATPAVPSTRIVASLEAALREVRRLGGTVTSETRTVPGIGTWAFVAEVGRSEVVLWEDAPRLG